MTKGVVVFIDFDGTICATDISNSFFCRFAGEDARIAVREWKEGRITSWACLQREIDAYTGDVYELQRHACEQPIDGGFGRLIETCKDLGVDVLIVSDGLDFYIEPLLKKHGFKVKFYANHLEVRDGKRLLSFPHHKEACGKCANCKSSHVEREKQLGRMTIYVGDGLSDRCAATKADLVFAKGDLRDYCLREGIRFSPFQDLEDVASELKRILKRA